MGFLAQGFGYGGSPGQAAGSSLGWGGLGALTSSAAPVLSGVGAFEQGSYQSQVMANNAAIERQNASATLAAGDYEGSAEKLRTGIQVGHQLAAQGANGIDVGGGSATAVRQSTQAIGDMDAAMIHYNAQRAAFGQEAEAANLQSQSKLDKLGATGALEEGLFKGGSTLLTSASSLGDKWSQYRLAFGG